VGIGLSSLLFVLAPWTYGEPFMLVGVTLLSLTYALLTRWRGSVWAAAAAHAVFDGVQLLVLVPLAMEQLAPDHLPSLAAALGAAWGLW
jgi:membrane protease YdiL (CAAX protease family)